ncbi:hypothetical protein PG2006B_0166 [Bifidobacterium animalis subsp. animalis]|nr:hypothetical protein PG2006B_0166 [Bifidobacterium animalis subsp. animalis]
MPPTLRKKGQYAVSKCPDLRKWNLVYLRYLQHLHYLPYLRKKGQYGGSI